MYQHLTDEEIAKAKNEIDEASHFQLARAWRFAGDDCNWFSPEVFPHYQARFNTFGGMTPQISKQIGW